MNVIEQALRRYYGGSVRAARQMIEARHFERNITDEDKQERDFRKANYRRNKWDYEYEDRRNGK